MEHIAGFLSPAIIYGIVFFLNVSLPGRWVIGYVTKPGSMERQRYRLNGLNVLICVLVCWGLLCYVGIMPWDWFYSMRWYSVSGAISTGLVFSFIVFEEYPPVHQSGIADFYFGRAINIQLLDGRIDLKMWLYLAGASMLAVNVMSLAAHHLILYGINFSTGVMLSAGLLVFFVFDYLFFEEIHLYTYDLFAERVGFKLGWGCLAFYPWFYAIPLWSTVSLPVKGLPAGFVVLSALIFLAGWILSRGANLQKYYFKKDPARSFLHIAPKCISAGDQSLLVNGFWGISRHINYLGEILMATGIVLATGHASLIWPWLYPLYYVVLLFPRQLDDHKRCALKYGPLWDQYVEQVPYKIIPFLY